MKKLLISILGILAIPFLASAVYAPTQTGYYPSFPTVSVPPAGYILQNQGLTTAWVSTSSLGISPNLSNYVTFPYASSTFLTINNASNTYQPLGSYATTGVLSNYYLTSNPAGYITSTSTAFIPLASSSLYYLNSNPSGYISSTTNALTNYPTFTYASNTFQTIGNYLTGVIADSPLSGAGTSASHLIWTNPGYIMNIAGQDLSTANNATSAFITASALSPYLTSATAASTYYLQTNPSGYITSSSLSPYLTITSAGNTYLPLSASTSLNYQAVLFSGTNIKTVNGNTILGSGNLTIGSSGLASTSPFTAGYVPYATSSGSLTNSNIFTSGLFTGIGNTNPNSVLTVNGSTTLNTNILNWGNTYTGSLENPLSIYGTIPTGGDTSGSPINFYPNQGTGANNSGDFIFYSGYNSTPITMVDSSYTSISNVKISTTTVTDNSTTNRYLLVSLGFNSNSTTTSSITYGGASMTQLSSTTDSFHLTREEIWGLVAPATGINNLVATFSGTTTPTIISWLTLNNVNQTTPTEYPNASSSPQQNPGGFAYLDASTSQSDFVYTNSVSTSSLSSVTNLKLLFSFNGLSTSTFYMFPFYNPNIPYPGTFNYSGWSYMNSTPFSMGNISIIPAQASTTANTLSQVVDIGGVNSKLGSYLTVNNNSGSSIFNVSNTGKTVAQAFQLPNIANSLLQTDASGNVFGVNASTYLTQNQAYSTIGIGKYMTGGILNTTSLTVANYGTWDGSHLWTTNYYGDSISEISATGTLLATYNVSPYNPIQLAYDGSSIWIASGDSNGHLIRFNPLTATTTVFTENPSGLGAGGIQGILYASSTLFIGVSQYGGGAGSGFIAEISTTTGAQIASSTGMTNVNGLTYTNGFVWGGCSGFISRVNAVTMASTTYTTSPDTTTYRITTDGTYIYGADFGSGNIRQWNTSGSLIKTFKGSPSNNAITFDGTNLWTVGDSGTTGLVTILSPSSGTIINTFGGGSSDIIFDGTYMWGINADNNTVNKFQITPNPMGSITVQGNEYLTGGLYDSTNATGTTGQILTSTGTSTLWTKQRITIQIFTSGSGTYTKPAGVAYIEVKMVGGGAGGGSMSGVGTSGATSTFGTSFLTAGAGWAAVSNRASATSSATIGAGAIGVALGGGAGQGGSYTANTTAGETGGMGGSTPFGGAGAGGSNATTYGIGTSATPNSGSGGGGAGGLNTSGGDNAGSGGGAGGYIDAYITSPATSYSYTVGTGGNGNTSGTTGAGGNGGSGFIEVIEYY